MNHETARLLGFARTAGLEALNRVPGPDVYACVGPDLVALLQPEPDTPLLARGRKAIAEGLLTVQRRLEVACEAGAFLPMDPSAACCPAGSVPSLLEPAWPGLADAFRAHGHLRQWDVTLKWTPQSAVARNREAIAAAAADSGAAMAEAVGAALLAERGHREAALLEALGPVVRAFAAGGAARSETEVAVTVLLGREGEAPLEAALDALPCDDAAIHMRGPLPPLNFAAVRLARVEADDISKAWRLLALEGRVDLAALHRQWRLRAAAAHPDRRASESTVTVSDLTAAYRVLKPLVLADPGVRFHTLNGLLRHAGFRLVVPEPAAARTPARVPELVS